MRIEISVSNDSEEIILLPENPLDRAVLVALKDKRNGVPRATFDVKMRREQGLYYSAYEDEPVSCTVKITRENVDTGHIALER